MNDPTVPPVEEHEPLLETLNILSDADTMDALAEAEAGLGSGRRPQSALPRSTAQR